MEVTIMIPISYVVGSSNIDIVDFDTIDLQASYINKVYDISWTKNNRILIKKVYESSSATPQIIDNLHATNFDGTNIGMVNELHLNTHDNHQHMDHSEQHSFRRRRDVAEAFNESPLNEDLQGKQHHVQARSVQTFHDENILANLPFNRTMFFKCHTIPMDDESLCVKGTFSVRNFRAGSAPIMVNINYTVDGSIIGELFTILECVLFI
jgi:RecG-like helicase